MVYVNMNTYPVIHWYPAHIIKRPYGDNQLSKHAPNPSAYSDNVSTEMVTSSLPDSHGEKRFALIVLNVPLKPLQSLFDLLWFKRSVFRTAADGGANWLHELGLSPDLIVGDLDSISSEVERHFASEGIEVCRMSDQESTDMHKACLETLRRISLKLIPNGQKIEGLVVLTSSCGRLDHMLAQMDEALSLTGWEESSAPGHLLPETPYRHAIDGRSLPIYLLSPESLAWVMLPGYQHVVHLDGSPTHTCGLLALEELPTEVLTTGLMWNLNGPPESGGKFRRLLSACNKYISQTVTVCSDAPLLWIMNYRLDESVSPEA